VYIPNVIYTYQVEGAEYQGEKINFSAVNNFNSKEDCDNYLDVYRNRAVEIFYNTNDPNESTLSVNTFINLTIITRVVVAEVWDFFLV
jgi:hypothetical protein